MHLIITTKSDNGNISGIIRDFKKYTSNSVTKEMQQIPESRREWVLNPMCKEAQRTWRAKYDKLWKDDNRWVTIDGKIVSIKERLDYIHNNPLRNGLIEEPWHYLYSSAKDYQGKKGLELLNLFINSTHAVLVANEDYKKRLVFLIIL